MVALAFGFTSCPEVCPTTLAVLAQAREKLGPKASELQVVYVTVDPERDDAARMKQYLAGFDPSFVGGTGTEAQLAAVRREFGVRRPGATARRGNLRASSYIYLIDRNGSGARAEPTGHSAADYAHDVRALLASNGGLPRTQGSPPAR